ncbi:MAG: hypothetical protein CVU22_20475 [Betaproteobacteria bacterium HGW-Betaproteobacteria-16]|nr:MAG: hypothetical protein CVU22_20475 [Betaproteobacteria bacterium HGW-Betaproteobacteria-16]
MRALLAILIFVMMPLQFSAAGQGCCAQMASVQAEQMQLSEQPLLLAETDSKELSFHAGIDLDCGTCHANCAAALIGAVVHSFELTGAERAEHIPERFRLPWAERPLRPKWPTPSRSGLRLPA